MAAKKKESPKERRIREEQEKKNKFRAIDEKRKEEKAKETTAVNSNSVKISTVKPKKKSLAKINGLKSMLAVGDDIYLTSFGSGNDSLIESKFSNGEQTIIANPANISAEDEKATIQIKSTRYSTSKPGHATKANAVRQDIIGAKANIEKRFFGNTEEYQDNIHIQLAYNILDIEKILAEYVDNIIYCINNVSGIEDPDNEFPDLIGVHAIDSNIDLENEMFKQFVSCNRLGYFGNAFYHNELDKKKSGKNREKTCLRKKEDIALIIELLGSLRQFIKHGRSNPWLYILDNEKTNKEFPEKYKVLLDEMYSERVNSVNDTFIETNKKSLLQLFKALDLNSDEEKKKCASDYYRFIVKKDARNIGFSVKQIREIIIDEHLETLRGKGFDGARSMINKWIDFIIFRYCVSEEGKAFTESFVDTLRRSISDEEKEKNYSKSANKLYGSIKVNIDRVFENIQSGKDISKINGELDADAAKTWIEDVCVKVENTSYFTKLMYMLTLFLDGKEINILLSTLINKFENIQSFIGIMETLNLDMFDTSNKHSDYSFFYKSAEIAEQLRTVKSFARMDAPLQTVEWVLYQDALRILGLPDDDLEKYRTVIFPPRIEKNNKVQKSDTNLRNFIKNNVINSSRFQYLIRFTNVEQIRNFAKNQKIVEFVLKQIPKSQIEKYYDSCVEYNKDRKHMVQDLALEINNFSFNRENIGSVKQKGVTYDEKAHKERLVAIIGLYLTVLYIIAKNLVNINARYTIAIHSLERDTKLVLDKTVNRDNGFEMVNHYIECQLEREQMRRAENKRFNKKALNEVTSNRDKMVISYGETGEALFREYRNAIAHLTAVTGAAKYAQDIREVKSYFDIYHYAMQRFLLESKIKEEERNNIKDIQDFYDNLNTYKKYQKDLVWLLNVPFAYNFPRYKSLSIADLFKKEMQPVTFGEDS